MAQGSENLVPISMAVALHAVLLASMLVAFDFVRPAPVTPPVIYATLVPDVSELTPPPRVEREPEPEPVVELPEPEPDNREELQREAEAEKRAQDALIEKERLERMRQQEEADKLRKQREEEARKKRAEEEQEKRLEEAERKREEDEQRQREENESQRRELEAADRQAELEADERRFTARTSAEMDAYKFAIAQDIQRSWAPHAEQIRCTVRVNQIPGGEIVGVKILTCDGGEAVRRSVEAAIYGASPLPEPPNPDLFERNLTLNLTFDREY